MPPQRQKKKNAKKNVWLMSTNVARCATTSG